MAAFDDESVCSTERLLKPECSPIDLEDEQLDLRVSSKKGFWARIWQRRLSFLIHLAIAATYTISLSLMLEHVSKQCEHGPDLVDCELTCRPNYVVAC
jgi:hypothetical protein